MTAGASRAYSAVEVEKVSASAHWALLVKVHDKSPQLAICITSGMRGGLAQSHSNLLVRWLAPLQEKLNESQRVRSAVNFDIRSRRQVSIVARTAALPKFFSITTRQHGRAPPIHWRCHMLWKRRPKRFWPDAKKEFLMPRWKHPAVERACNCQHKSSTPPPNINGFNSLNICKAS